MFGLIFPRLETKEAGNSEMPAGAVNKNIPKKSQFSLSKGPGKGAPGKTENISAVTTLFQPNGREKLAPHLFSSAKVKSGSPDLYPCPVVMKHSSHPLGSWQRRRWDFHRVSRGRVGAVIRHPYDPTSGRWTQRLDGEGELQLHQEQQGTPSTQE